MTDTDTQAKPKAPPAWMKREPLSREGTAARLVAMAEASQTAAQSTAAQDVKAGLFERAAQIARASRAVSLRIDDAQALQRMQDYGESRLACAKATTEEAARASYMDDAHAFREAVRYLKGA